MVQDIHARRRLVLVAGAVTVLALLHHIDHVIRGNLVLDRGLPSAWNHSGWPAQAAVTPFTASLGVYLLLIPGILLTLRGRARAGYWLAASIVLFAIVGFVHYVPGEKAETPRVVHDSYASAPAGAAAVAELFALTLALGTLAAVAIWARRVSGRW